MLVMCSSQCNTFFDMFDVDFVQFLFLGWATSRRGLSIKFKKTLFYWIQNTVTSKYRTSQYSHFNIEYKKIENSIVTRHNAKHQNTATSKYTTSEHVKLEYSDSKYMTSQYSHFSTEYKIQQTVLAQDTIFKMQSITQNTVTSKYMT